MVRHWSQISALATRHDETEVLMMRQARCHPEGKPSDLLLCTAIAARSFELRFFRRRADARERAACGTVPRRVKRLAQFTNVAAKLIGIEMCITAVRK